MNKTTRTFVTILCTLLVLSIIYFTCIPSGVSAFEKWKTSLQKAKDDTNYTIRKEVEDTCRAMIAQYHTDIDRYNLYKNSTDTEKLSWAEESYMRACQTANEYNNYILKNSFVWANNIPADIDNYLNMPLR